MRILTGIVTMILLASCNNNEIAAGLAQSDSVDIRFAQRKTNNLSEATANKKAIATLAGFIGKEEKSLPLECEAKPDGMILFYKGGKPHQVVLFTELSQECRYFITKLNGKTIYTGVSNEAADFLTAIQEGKSTY